MIGLQVEPKLGRGSQRLGEQPRSLRRHAALAPDELVDALHWDAQMSGKRDVGDPKCIPCMNPRSSAAIVAVRDQVDDDEFESLGRAGGAVA